MGLPGSASPGEIKARYRSLAQRCRFGGEARPEEHARLLEASLALAQELSYQGYDEEAARQLLIGEGCPADVAAEVARVAAGPVSRVVPAPLERVLLRPEDAAYARLAERTLAAESMRNATASSYGFGFIIRLAIAFVLVMGALIASLDFFPRALRPAKVAPQPAAAYPVQLVPPSRNEEKR